MSEQYKYELRDALQIVQTCTAPGLDEAAQIFKCKIVYCFRGCAVVRQPGSADLLFGVTWTPAKPATLSPDESTLLDLLDRARIALLNCAPRSDVKDVIAELHDEITRVVCQQPCTEPPKGWAAIEGHEDAPPPSAVQVPDAARFCSLLKELLEWADDRTGAGKRCPSRWPEMHAAIQAFEAYTAATQEKP